MVFRDASKFRQPLAKEAVAVLEGVCMCVANDVRVGVGDGQMTVYPLLFLDILVDRGAISTENDSTVAVLGDIFVSVFQILADEKPNSSVGVTDECQDWWLSPSKSPRPFSPAVT
jgi:hypothetical protein